MYNAEVRGDRATVSRWGERWLNELDATKPANDDERSALDVARVDAASVLGDPMRVLPALIASEQAMPNNYNASLRLAQMANEAKQYDEAIAACKRGLAHVSGPIGRTWLLQTEAAALSGKGQPVEAKRVLQAALRSARLIGVKGSRERNIGVISKALKEMENAAK
jgi:tetratricopeptide (TPR) repeat protein